MLHSLKCKIILAACLLLLALLASNSSFGFVSANKTEESKSAEGVNQNENEQQTSPTKEPRRMLDWQRYQRMYKKHYKSLTEQAFRFKEFLSHWLRVAASRIAYHQKKSPYYLELNRLSDQSIEELRAKYGVKPSDDDLKFLNLNPHDVSAQISPGGERFKRGANFFSSLFQGGGGGSKSKDELMIDHRTSGCLQQDQIDQGDCGSCYAMAMIKLYEWMYCTNNNGNSNKDEKFIKFSEQILVDCGKPSGLKGCERGSYNAAMKFIDSYGLLASKKHPYVGVEQQCPMEQNSELTREMESRKPKTSDAKPLRIREWVDYLKERPLLVYLFLDDDLWDYGGGLFTYRKDKPKELPNCDKSLGHFMVLVGHGRVDGQEYWLLANSYGNEWGEGGYMRLAKAGDDCIGSLLSIKAEF